MCLVFCYFLYWSNLLLFVWRNAKMKSGYEVQCVFWRAAGGNSWVMFLWNNSLFLVWKKKRVLCNMFWAIMAISLICLVVLNWQGERLYFLPEAMDKMVVFCEIWVTVSNKWLFLSSLNLSVIYSINLRRIWVLKCLKIFKNTDRNMPQKRTWTVTWYQNT